MISRKRRVHVLEPVAEEIAALFPNIDADAAACVAARRAELQGGHKVTLVIRVSAEGGAPIGNHVHLGMPSPIGVVAFDDIVADAWNKYDPRLSAFVLVVCPPTGDRWLRLMSFD